jgi:hypothetical protein
MVICHWMMTGVWFCGIPLKNKMIPIDCISLSGRISQRMNLHVSLEKFMIESPDL